MPLLRIEKKAPVVGTRREISLTSDGSGNPMMRIGIHVCITSVSSDDADFRVARHGGCQYVLSWPRTDVFFFMKRKTRLWVRFVLVVLLGGGAYLLMRDYEQEFVYAPTSFVKKTPHDAGM